MSNTTITDLMPLQSNIHGTIYEEFLNNTMGYFLELLEDEIEEINNGLFVESANGKYLDLHGKDYGLERHYEETDEEYRARLLVEPLDKFNIQTLYEVYNLQLLTNDYEDYNKDTTLLSDNHYLASAYVVDCSDEVWEILNKKYILTKNPNGEFLIITRWE